MLHLLAVVGAEVTLPTGVRVLSMVHCNVLRMLAGWKLWDRPPSLRLEVVSQHYYVGNDHPSHLPSHCSTFGHFQTLLRELVLQQL